MGLVLPDRPPFALRARLVTPLTVGGTRYEADGLIVVDDAGRLAYAGAAAVRPAEADAALDLRPWVIAPGMVDLHAHLPQMPNAGLGFSLDLLTWLDRLTFPTERAWADPAVAERLAPPIFEAFAAAGTTTVLAYGVVFEAAMDVAFRAAEAHGIRAILGKVMMDRGTYDRKIVPSTILDRSLRETSDLIGRWHGADDGRLGYAVTPRFAISCTTDMLRESAELARASGAWWQTHVAEDPFEIAEVHRLFPDARDYLDVYDRAGALGERAILAQAIHLSDAALAAGRERFAHRPLPGLEPVPRRRDHAARALPRSGRLDRARERHRGRPGCLAVLGHARRGIRPDGAAQPGRRRGRDPRSARLAQTGDPGRRASPRAR